MHMASLKSDASSPGLNRRQVVTACRHVHDSARDHMVGYSHNWNVSGDTRTQQKYTANALHAPQLHGMLDKPFI